MKGIIKIFTLFFLSSTILISQEIEAEVNVNVERLSQDARIDVSTMEQDVEDYINSQKFTDIEWEGPPIPVDINIALSSAGQGQYNGQIFVASKRYIYGQDGGTSVTMKVADNQWSFEYSQGAFFNFNPNKFNNFTSIIDFYMLIAIGMDLDTYATLGGNPAYRIAKRIANNGASADAPGFDTYVKPGEFTKYSLVSELSEVRYEPLRRLFFEYYVDGLDMMAEDREQGLKNLRQVIADMKDFKKNKMVGPSVLLQAFFDAKAYELGSTFEGYEDQSVFKDLKYLDPSNSTIYEEHEGK